MTERNAPENDSSSARHRRMLAERVRLLEANLPNTAVGTVICLVAAGTLLQGTMSRGFLWAWLGAQVLLLGLRIASVLWRRPSPESGDDVRARLFVGVANALLSGSLWGLLGYVGVASPDPQANLVVIMILTGLVGGATAISSHLPQVYLSYVVTIIAPASLYLLFAGDEPGAERWVGALLALYLAFSAITSRTAGAAVRQSIEFRHRNADLVDGLREAHRGAEEERRRAEAALERERRANLAKSRFLAAASHDLRQPLHSLGLHVATLRSQTRETRHAPAVSAMSRSVHALDELFDAILDVSRLDAGTLEPELVHAPLAPLLERLANEFEPLAADRGLTLRVDAPGIAVRTDLVLLERLLRNLLTNAIRYTSSGSVRIEVDGARGAWVRLRVVDTGPGIPPADRARVFEEFEQLGNPERDRSQGIGLGLSIVRRVAGLLGLDVMLGDTPGGGTTVTVSVPRGIMPLTAPVAGPPGLDGPDEPLGMTVLIVEDEEAVREAMADFLETHGCTVLAADAPEEAIGALEASGHRLDAIVCDYRLHGGERGTEAVARVRAHCGREVPAILVTGDTAIEGLRDIRDSALQVLHKPCDPRRLLGILTAMKGEENPSRAIGDANG